MMIQPRDFRYLGQKRIQAMLDEYEERFGERFPSFNYVDFQGAKEKRSVEIWSELLAKALENNKPYHIESKLMEFMEWLGYCGGP